MDMGGRVCLMVMFVMLAMGHTLYSADETDRLKANKPLIMGTLTIFLLSYVAFFIWENLESNREDQSNVWESPPGIVNLVIRSVIWMIFLLCVVKTRMQEDNAINKCLFLTSVTFVGTVWFLNLPCIVLISQQSPTYWRYKIIMCTTLAVNLIVESLLAMWLCYDGQPYILLNYRALPAAEDGITISGGGSPNLNYHPPARGHMGAPLPKSEVEKFYETL